MRLVMACVRERHIELPTSSRGTVTLICLTSVCMCDKKMMIIRPEWLITG